MHHLQILKDRLREIRDTQETITIELQGNTVLVVTPVFCEDNIIGVNVTGLGNSPFLSIDVFVATISLLNLMPNQRARKGSALGGVLGSAQCPTDSVEGHVAKVVFGYNNGDWVFQRITPISRILEWAGVCLNGRGFLQLL